MSGDEDVADTPAAIIVGGVGEKRRKGSRGKEAGPALNPLKGILGFPPPDANTYRTLKTKLTQ
jgi:hypothetical protein